LIQHLIFLLLFLLSLPILRDFETKKVFPTYFFSFIGLFLFAALRYGYGNDYFSYYNYFSLSKIDAISDIEIGYVFLSKIFPNYFLLVAFLSFVQILSLFLIFKSFVNVKYYWLSLAYTVINIDIFLIGLSAQRQMLAISMIVLSIIVKIKFKNSFLSLLLISLAPLFHISSVFVIPIFYFISSEKWIKKYIKLQTIILILILLFLISTFFEEASINLFQSSFEQISNFLSPSSKYLKNYIINEYRKNPFTVFLTYGTIAIISCYFLKFVDPRFRFFGNLYIIGNIFYILSIIHFQFSRIGFYFIPFGIVYVYAIATSKTSKIIKISLLLLIFIIYAVKYYNFFNAPLWEPFHEYKTIFSVI